MVEKHDHVHLGVVALLIWQLRVLDKSIERAEGTGEVVESWGRDKLLMETHQARRLRVVQAELKVDDVVSAHIEVSSHQLGEVGQVSVVELESVIVDLGNITSEEFVHDSHSEDRLQVLLLVWLELIRAIQVDAEGRNFHQGSTCVPVLSL